MKKPWSIGAFLLTMTLLKSTQADAKDYSLPAPVCTVREAGLPETRVQCAAPGSQQSSTSHLALKATLARKRAEWRADAHVTSLADQEREMVVGFEVLLPESLSRFFCSDGRGEQPLPPSGSVTYRSDCSLPAVTFYDDRQGVTLFAPFDLPAPGLVFKWEREKDGLRIVVEVTNLGLASAGKCRAGLIAVAHEGDWRPGLGCLVRHYPQYFHPPNPGVLNYDGPMIYDFVTPEDRLRRDLGQDLAWQELGWSWPHLGLYLPEEDPWQRQPGSEGGLGEGGTVTRKLLRDYIHRATSLGVGQFLYFQSTESWAEYAEQHFPGSRVRTANGDLVPTWVKCVVMNPDPALPFGQHIARQADALMDTFPELAGFFWDQNCYAFFDVGHDDGISMADGRRVSMMEFAQNRLQRLVAKRIHARGKSIFTNGAYTVGLSRYCDGVMSEGLGTTRRLQYICMMKPLTLLAYDSSLGAARDKVRLALETGGQPSVTLGGDECREFCAGYRTIFQLLRGKEWVFHPRALKLPERWRGNIFRNPRGHYIVTLAPPESETTHPAERLRTQVVCVRLPQKEQRRSVYLLSPEVNGRRRVRFESSSHNGQVEYTIYVPPLPECGAVVIARPSVSAHEEAWVPASSGIEVEVGSGEQPAQVSLGEEVEIAIANRSAEPREVEVKTLWQPGGIGELVRHQTLAGDEVKKLSVPVSVLQGGSWTLQVSVEWPGNKVEKTMQADVADSFLPPGFKPEHLTGLTLQLDAFNSLGDQYANKPVRINGVDVGRLPVTGQTLKWHEGLTITFPVETARQVMEKGAQPSGDYALSVTVDNAVYNCFKVRSLRARLRLGQNEEILSTWNREVRCSDAGWLYAEGKSVSLGQAVEAGSLRFFASRERYTRSRV